MKIKTIKKIQKEKTYDLNIDKTYNHNYFIKVGEEDVLVHNSGKDASKVDRSAAYMARYIAKNMCAAGVSDKVQVQLSYAIGESEPISIYIKDEKHSPDNLEKIVREVFDLTPQGIIDTLELDKPIFSKTTNYGHFGKEDLPWEKLDKVETIKGLLNE